MAHHVQAGAARPKVRSPLGVWALAIFTGGLYAIYWWQRTVRDLAEFERTDGGTSSINPVLETGGLVLGIAGLSVAQLVFREEVTAQNPLTGITETTSQMTSTGVVVMLAGLVVILVFAARLRGHMRRVMTRAGMLPEELPGSVTFWAVSLIFSYAGAANSVQTGLNSLWKRYPRWYKSLGGTKEAVVSGAAAPTYATTTGAPAMHVDQPMPAGTPGMHVAATQVSVMPAAAAAFPAAPAPPFAQPVQSSAADVLRELAPRAAAGQLGPQEAFQYARAAEEVHGAEGAAPWYEFVANSDPTNAHAAYWVGIWRIDRADGTGLAYLHRAAQDAGYRSHACGRIIEYLERTGRSEEAAQWRAHVA